MKTVLEKLQALEASRLTRLGVKLILVLTACLLLAWPHIKRPLDNLLSGIEPYYHLQAGAFGVILSFLNHYLGVDKILLAKMIPWILGLLVILMFYEILRKLAFSYDIVILSTLILIISPNFVYLFGTLNVFALTIPLFLFAFYLLMNKNEFFAVLTFYIIAIFGFLQTYFVLTLILVYSLKNKRFRLFLMALPSLAIAYFTSMRTLSGSGSFVSDFGGLYGLGLFVVFLSFFGLIHLWQKKYKHIFVYILLLVMIIFSIINQHMLNYLNLVLVVLAALGFVQIIRSEWRSNTIKELTLWIMVCGLLFSGVSHVVFVSDDLPSKEVVDALDHLKELPQGKVLSSQSRMYWIKYIGQDFVAYDELFQVRELERASHLIKGKNIKYIWIDNDMKSEIWQREEQGLQFVLEYSNMFKMVYKNSYVTIWEVRTW